jgi:hypothetical protein
VLTTNKLKNNANENKSYLYEVYLERKPINLKRETPLGFTPNIITDNSLNVNTTPPPSQEAMEAKFADVTKRDVFIYNGKLTLKNGNTEWKTPMRRDRKKLPKFYAVIFSYLSKTNSEGEV